MYDDRLSLVLGSLPRDQAPPGFTGGVLQRLESRRPGLFPARWTLTAAAAAALAMALGLGWQEHRHRRERAETLARFEALLIDKQQLEAELASLQRLTAEARPVVYLGGNEDVELVLDLARFHRLGGFGAASPELPPEARRPDALRPADLRPADLRADPRSAGQTQPLRVVY